MTSDNSFLSDEWVAAFVAALIAFQIVFLTRSFISRYTHIKSPISMVIDAVAKVVKIHWPVIIQDHPKAADASAVKIALAYLDRRAADLYRVEREQAARKAGEIWTRRRAPAEEVRTSNRSSQIVSALLFTLVALILACGALVGVVLALQFATREPLLVTLIAGGLYVLFRLVQWGSDRLSRLQVQEALAIGSGNQWRSLQPSTEDEIESDRARLITFLADTPNLSNELRQIRDPDVEIASSGTVPATPGITEITLSATTTAIDEIRNYLKKVRTQHTLTAAISIFCFVGALGFGLYATVFLHSNMWRVTFGGLAVTAVLGSFSFASLRDARVSQIALALFESYVAELRVNLAEAELATNGRERSDLRSIAWQKFRLGLNDLWLHEQGREGRGKKEHNAE